MYLKEQFTTYEIALRLKELNFNEDCFGNYVSHLNSDNIDLNIIKSNHNSGKYVTIPEDFYTDAPLWQQVIDWFRDKYDIHINITSWSDAAVDNFEGLILGRYEISVFKNSNKNPIKYIEHYYDDYKQAREQAVLRAIEMVEKEKYEKNRS